MYVDLSSLQVLCYSGPGMFVSLLAHDDFTILPFFFRFVYSRQQIKTVVNLLILSSCIQMIVCSSTQKIIRVLNKCLYIYKQSFVHYSMAWMLHKDKVITKCKPITATMPINWLVKKTHQFEKKIKMRLCLFSPGLTTIWCWHMAMASPHIDREGYAIVPCV